MKRQTLAALALLAAPAPALACGGFFCSSAPVDQSAERILFVQEDPQTVSAYVEIKFAGDPETFSWIVPVPAKPDMDVWHGAAFDALDQATQPVFNTPWQCFAPEAAAGGGLDDDADPAPVNVLAREQIGDYDTAVIESSDPRALVEWLRTNGYRITPEMEPFVALYTAEGMKFTAIKLVAGKGIDSIKPLKMTYPSGGPTVPLRLTSIAAQLEMGVKVWIVGDQRFGPIEGVENLELDDAELVFDPNTFQTNYLPLVARKVDAAGGRAFFTEYAQPSGPLADQIEWGGVPDWADEDAHAAFDGLLQVLRSKTYVTRLYTRLSPEEMTYDPIFVPIEGGDVSNAHTVPVPPGVDPNSCGGIDETALPDPCEFVACGAGGQCFVAQDGATGAVETGCACAEGAVARPQGDVAPGGAVRPTVACGDARLNFTAPDLVIDRPDLTFSFDPCRSDPCGDGGECVAMNGSQSCRCERGFVAVGRVDPEGKPFATCVEPRDRVPDEFYERELPEPDLPFPGRRAKSRGAAVADDGCSAVGSSAPAGLALLALVFAPLARRPRRPR